MSEQRDYFVVARTFTTAFVSDSIECYVEAESPAAALEALTAKHRHPIFAAGAWATADDYYRDRAPLARWRSNKALSIDGVRSVYSIRPSRVTVDGKWITVEDPRAGRIV